MKNMVEKTYYVFKKYINHHRRTVRNRGIKDVTGECSEGMKECGFGDQKKRVSLLDSGRKFSEILSYGCVESRTFCLYS